MLDMLPGLGMNPLSEYESMGGVKIHGLQCKRNREKGVWKLDG